MNIITSKSGKTITLRPPKLSDVHQMLDLINTISMEDIYLDANPSDLYTLKKETEYLEEVLKKINKKKAIYTLAFLNDVLIGVCDLNKLDKRRKHIGTFGITLVKDFRSDGIGTQLAKYVIDQATHKLDIQTIILSVYQPNQLAYNLYKKLGFTEYGKLPSGLSYKDNFIDEILMYKQLS